MTVSILNAAYVQTARYGRQIGSILAHGGMTGLLDRIRHRLAGLLRPKGTVWPVRPEDVIAADLRNPPPVTVPPVRADNPIVVNWVMNPASRGSGGHTTIFRILKYLDRQGYRNRIYFYDPYGGDLLYYESIARTYYGLDCEIGAFGVGMADAHAVIATGWPSAYAVFNAQSAGKRFYFVQDYEPDFYPAGTFRALAENTYRMPFHAIAAGRWLAEKLGRDFGMPADHFPFGCDTANYRLENHGRRDGIVFYARPGNARRATELGLLALELFARRHRQIEIHLFGGHIGRMPFACIDHGVASPARLNEIYNRCMAGLSLSMTNVSLVPHEMLAAGCIPVVNDAVQNRIVLDNPHVRYAALTPSGLADALSGIVAASDFADLSQQGAASVKAVSWESAGAAVDAALRRALTDGEKSPGRMTAPAKAVDALSHSFPAYPN